jgi:cytoskeleton protein RodZ
MAGLRQIAPDNRVDFRAKTQAWQEAAADCDVPAGGVGRELSRAREWAGKTLMDVSAGTKIPPHHLAAIETSRFDALPARVYAIGFVRNYAAYLGLDADALVARLRDEVAAHDAVHDAPPVATASRKDAGNGRDGNVPARKSATKPAAARAALNERRSFSIVTAGLLLAAILYSGYSVFDSARQAAVPPVMTVPAQLAAEAGLIPDDAVAQPQTGVAHRTPSAPAPTREAAPLRTVEELPLDIAIALPAQPALAPLLEIASDPPVPKEKPAFAADQSPAARPDDAQGQRLAVTRDTVPASHAPLPLGRRYGMANRNPRIILRMHRATRVAVQGTQNRVFIDRILNAGDTYRVPNMTGLKLSAPDAGAVEVILDDTTIGFAGKDGVVAKSLPLDPQSIVRQQRRG